MTGTTVRSAVLRATMSTHVVGQGARHLARETVGGAIRAVGEIVGETGSFVSNTVIGVMEGTGQVVTLSVSVVREVVVSAVRGTNKVGVDAADVGREAVEGAIVGRLETATFGNL